MGAGNGNIVGIMINNLPDKANISIAMSVESGYVLVMYMPYDKNKTRSIADEDIMKSEMKELFNNMK